ncbi:hypothetical protein bpr_II054 (plasmid) [Butyrivibrio proteoclasticus B316]|uniref:Uncharacterized protein n=2 Tax=Butyrivibrio proteoclasticus TaxID=43305 RepID=E0S3L2_BUTPB|nr:hypothetical protein bpr_II054 [Butyrivibrio proteoclasticus B316]
MYGSPCFICHNKGDQMKLMKLQRLKEMCEDSDAEKCDIRKSHINSFTWGIHSHCRFGLSCPELESFDSSCRRIAEDIEERLIQIAMCGSDKEYHDIHDMLRGDFSAVCHAMDIIRHTSRYKGE